MPLCRVAGRDAAFSERFWLVDLDVRHARRHVLVKHDPNAPAARRRQSLPRREGWLSGAALLLGVDGRLLRADVYGSSEVGDNELEFEVGALSEGLASGANWSWTNTARWRPDPNENQSVRGLVLAVLGEQWEGRWAGDRDPKPGRGTSASLKRFLDSGGRTNLPRYY